MNCFFNDALVWIVIAIALLIVAVCVFGAVVTLCAFSLLCVVVYALLTWNFWRD